MEGKINQANGRLRVANVRVKIQQLGNRLYLQATLPAKPGSKNKAPHQQRIALGISASPAGISLAEKEARKVGALLDCRQFDWTPYLAPKLQTPQTVGDWIDQFAREFQHTVAAITWETDYLEPFNRLDTSKPLTYDLLEQSILELKPDSRQRKRVCSTFGRLAKFAGLEGDFKHLQGNYSASRVDPRSLPSDQEIASFWQQISNPAWRWVYGMMATYGLRNHEVFFLDLADFTDGADVITVTDGKTKRRQVWPYYPEWIDAFSLRELQLPPVTGRKHSDYGDRVTCYLRSRAKMPFQPYDLRHAWAVRTILFGLPDTLAAQQMGHSVTVHTNTYHHWITARTHQQVHDSLMSRTDRPVAPRG